MPRRLLDADGFHDRRNLDDMPWSRNAVSRNLNSSTHASPPFPRSQRVCANGIVPCAWPGSSRPSSSLIPSKKAWPELPPPWTGEAHDVRSLCHPLSKRRRNGRTISVPSHSSMRQLSYKSRFRIHFIRTLYYTVSSASNAKRRTNEKAERSEPHQISRRT